MPTKKEGSYYRYFLTRILRINANSPPGAGAKFCSWLGGLASSPSPAKAAREKDNQTDQENQSQPAPTHHRAAKIETAAAEEKKQDNHK
jgi:hypothetical protein